MSFEREVPLYGFTSIGIGGRASFFLRARDKEVLKEGIEFSRSKDVPLFILGGGSNTVLGDVRGLVIRVEEFFPLEVFNGSKEVKIKVSGGTPLKEVIGLAVRENLDGIFRLAGFPATVGGAVAMNAGAFGVEIADFIDEVEFVDWEGKVHRAKRDELTFGYRKSPFPEIGVVTEVLLKLRRADKNVKEEFGIIRERRKSSQPINKKTSGSTFKNPSGGKAGRLLEMAGMKGYRIGNVCFSDLHANFMINLGGATLSEVRDLIETAREKVKESTGYLLEEEVRLIEDSGSDGWKVL